MIPDPTKHPKSETTATAAQQRRRARLAEAKHQFHQYLTLGAIDPAIALYELKVRSGEDWTLDLNQLQPIVQHLQEEKRWEQAERYLSELVRQLQSRVNNARLTLAQVAVKKTSKAEVAIEALAGLDHRQLSVDQRDLAIEMQGRARRRMIHLSEELPAWASCVEATSDPV